MQQKTKSRAIRRHHVARLKQSRRFYHGQDMSQLPRQLGKVVATAAVCSCWMCGNPRRFDGEVSIQEQRSMQAEGWDD